MKYFLCTVLLVSIVTFSFGQSNQSETKGLGLTFIPDFTFTGSGLTGWKSIGGADWHANDGELTGKIKPGTKGSWLVSERSFQDIGVHLLFKYAPGGETGILFRIKKTNEGISGILVSIKDGEVTSYRLSLDPQWKELRREKLRVAGILTRLAPPPKPDDAPFSVSSAISNVNLPLTLPSAALRPGEWNQIEIFLDLNIIRSFLNDGGEIAGGATEETDGSYGPIALYAGGTSEVHFKDIKYKDLAVRSIPKEQSSPNFRVQRISDMYYSWGAGSADFNRDGFQDIVAGPYIYYGPGFTKFQEISPGFSLSPSRDFTLINCEYGFDFNGDGWPDVLTGPARGMLFINPKGESRRWDKYQVIPSIQSEISALRDIDGDGKPELIYEADGSICYAKPNSADATKPWIVHIVSEKGYSMPHGIGVGDINGDGRMDILNPNGWWEQPKDNGSHQLWVYHPQAFGRYGHRGVVAGGSMMGVYDVNGDHLNDVVTSLNAHGFGLAWFEQKRDSKGKISFVRHMISDDYSAKNAGGVTFSQPHGSAFADMDGDGIPDFIVGKRYWTHLDNYFDPDPYGPPVLYWYRTVRNPKAPGGAEFIPELIHNRSGAGADVLISDLDKDGAVDIVTSTDRGTFIFWNKSKRVKPKSKHAALTN